MLSGTYWQPTTCQHANRNQHIGACHEAGDSEYTPVQVACTPPGDIIIRITSAGGSYIRLVLLNVRIPLHALMKTCCSYHLAAASSILVHSLGA